MKQLISMRSLLIIATLFTFSSSFAQSTSKFELSAGHQVKQVSAGAVNARIFPGSSSTRFILITENPNADKIYIVVKSSSGKVYEKVTRKKLLRTVFDLSNVEDDNYTLTVSSPGNTFSKDLVLSTTYAATKNIEIR
jgi:hypothetical protein